MKLNKKSDKNQKIVGSLRRAQIINTFGPGSIVDFPDYSVMISGIDFWNYYNKEENYMIYEENLQNQLGVKYFLQPKIDEKTNNQFGDKTKDIVSSIFPQTFICKKCGKIDRYKRFKGKNKLYCNCGAEGKNIVPSRFIVACEKGHIDDFPYEWWVHRSTRDCDKPNIKMKIDKSSDGLEGIIICCETCKSNRNMKGVFTKEALRGIRCRGKRPWLKDEVNCDETLKTLQRGATNLYYGVHESALSIPPWSNRVNQIIGKVKYWDTLKKKAKNEETLKQAIEFFELEKECKCSIGEVSQYIKRKIDYENTDKSIQREEIRQDEYRSLCLGKYEEDDLHFCIEETDIEDDLRKYIEKIVLVKRLREVQSLIGFYRITPSSNDNEKEVTPIFKEKQEWYPAIELKGEGIFIKLNEDKLKEWENKIAVLNRFNKIKSNMENSYLKKTNISPRYILLHTLSHIIIRQLTLDSGYSSSSIKERIYSTFTNEQVENPIDMCGILIYTASPDSEGSLGGLVDCGTKERFVNILLKALEEATWCSSDPLCVESNGQGISNLNLGACYSCCLLPETSCEIRNCYLDRGLLIGKLNDNSMAYFEDIY